jgi:hypothetical protein
VALPFPSPDQETAECYFVKGGAAKVGRMEGLSPLKGEMINKMSSNPFTQAFAAQDVENNTRGG